MGEEELIRVVEEEIFPPTSIVTGQGSVYSAESEGDWEEDALYVWEILPQHPQAKRGGGTLSEINWV